MLHRAADLEGCSAWDIDDLPLRITFNARQRCWRLTPTSGDAWQWLVFGGLEDQRFRTRESARRAAEAELALRPLGAGRVGRAGRSTDGHWGIVRRRGADGRLGWAIVARSAIAGRVFGVSTGQVCRWMPTAHQAYRKAEEMSCELPC